MVEQMLDACKPVVPVQAILVN